MGDALSGESKFKYFRLTFLSSLREQVSRYNRSRYMQPPFGARHFSLGISVESSLRFQVIFFVAQAAETVVRLAFSSKNTCS